MFNSKALNDANIEYFIKTYSYNPWIVKHCLTIAYQTLATDDDYKNELMYLTDIFNVIQLIIAHPVDEDIIIFNMRKIFNLINKNMTKYNKVTLMFMLSSVKDLLGMEMNYVDIKNELILIKEQVELQISIKRK